MSIIVDLRLWCTYKGGGVKMSGEEQAKETEKVHQELHRRQKPHIHIDGSQHLNTG